jgi:hypothetical protein
MEATGPQSIERKQAQVLMIAARKGSAQSPRSTHFAHGDFIAQSWLNHGWPRYLARLHPVEIVGAATATR